MSQEKLLDVNDLLDACRELRRRYGDDRTLYFRGEGRSSWELRPSLMRISQEGFSLRSFEGEMLNDLITLQPQAFYQIDSALGQWVFAQHHGLKTRLLDITRNPLVALFNVCKDNESENGRLHVFAVPNSLIKPFNSDTIRVITNFAQATARRTELTAGKERGRYRRRCPSSLFQQRIRDPGQDIACQRSSLCSYSGRESAFRRKDRCSRPISSLRGGTPAYVRTAQGPIGRLPHFGVS